PTHKWHPSREGQVTRQTTRYGEVVRDAVDEAVRVSNDPRAQTDQAVGGDGEAVRRTSGRHADRSPQPSSDDDRDES
ncbi:MAG: hypothetical protein JXR83_03100, partial [Deltaproteobacteria bacterium]|nr:hypothetical protein [Deltaproteobacteria bacterium]